MKWAFHILANGKTISGDMDITGSADPAQIVPEDAWTVGHQLIKQLATEHPELHGARHMVFELAVTDALKHPEEPYFLTQHLDKLHTLLGNTDGHMTTQQVEQRLESLMDVLQQVVGVADALPMIALAKAQMQSATPDKIKQVTAIFNGLQGIIMDTISEAMPDYDTVLQQLHAAQQSAQ